MTALETQTGILRVNRVASRTWIFLVVVIGALLVSAAFYFDAAVRSWVAAHQGSGCLAFMKQVSRWGDWPSHVVLGLVLAIIAYARGNRRWLRVFVAMVAACALAGAAARIIKIGAGRARPSVESVAGWNGPQWSAKYHAFPSGHTASSAAFFAVLTFASWPRGAAFLVIPLLIGFSRLYVGAHHLSDVVCAALLGIVTAWLVGRSSLLAIENRKSKIEN